MPIRPPYICTRCLSRQRRQLYSTRPNTAPPPPPPPSGAAKLTTRRLISLHGPEAPKFLQGIITNNVRPESKSGFYAAFLTAQGKVLNDVFIYPTLGSQWHKQANGGGDDEGEQGYLVEVDAEQAEGLLRHMKKHKLRSKFRLRLLEAGEMDVWSVWREDERWTAHTHSPPVAEEGLLAMTDCRAPGMGQRILLPPSITRPSLLADVDEVPLSAYTIRRYLRGVPEGQTEIPREDSLPMNCNIDIMGGIDFRKGCYVGQELTIRTHHTGVVRRRMLPVALYAHGRAAPETLEYDPQQAADLEVVEEGAEIRKDDRRKKATGKLVGSVGNVGLGLCRVEQMSNLTVSAEGSAFAAEDRFVVYGAEGGKMGVKAVVPDWIRGRIREPRTPKRVE